MNHKHAERPECALLELTAEDREAAVRLLEKLVAAGPQEPSPDKRSLAEVAWRMYDARKDRRHFFSDDLFADPAWDMLLLLYCSETKALTISVSALCASTGLPQTSALRWVGVLEGRDLVFREPHPTDGRSTVVSLTDKARATLDCYFERVGKRYIG